MILRKIFVIASILIASIYFLLLSGGGDGSDPFVCLLLLIGYATSVVGLWASAIRVGMGFSLIYWFFSLVFYVFTPALFYFNNRWAFGGFSSEAIVTTRYALMLVLVQHAFVATAGQVAARSRRPTLGRRTSSLLDRVITQRGILALVVAAYVLTAVSIVAFGGFSAVFFRGAIFEVQFGGGKILPLILGVVVRPFVFYVFAVALWLLVQRISVLAFIVAVAALVPNVILNSPFGVARFFFFTLIVATMMMAAFRYKWINAIAVPFLFLGILGSSVINTLRWSRSVSDVSLAAATSGKEYFYEGHFDAFEMLCHGIDFVQTYGVMWGRQMAGAFLFWVPRFLWPGKPIGTGQFLGENYIGILESTKNTNLSAPTVLEFYINFGIVGVIAGGLLLGGLMFRLDSILVFVSCVRRRAVNMPVIFILIYCWIGLFFFFLRGDMLNAIAFISGFTLAFIPIYFVSGVRLPQGGGE